MEFAPSTSMSLQRTATAGHEISVSILSMRFPNQMIQCLTQIAFSMINSNGLFQFKSRFKLLIMLMKKF